MRVVFDLPVGEYVVFPLEEVNKLCKFIPEDVTVEASAARFTVESDLFDPIVIGRDVRFNLAGQLVDFDDDD